MFIDTHTHLYTEEFDADRREVVSRAFEAGAGALLLPNINAGTIDPMLDMCHQWPGRCFPMMGLHPTEFTSDPFPTLQAMHQLLQTDARYIGVGEVGLDFYYDEAPDADLQIQVLQEQARWAVEFQLPLMIHSRSAHRQLVDTLLPFAPQLPGGVFHCFGGTADEARELLERFPRFVLGVGGVLTFKKSTLPEVLHSAVPLSRIVLETDSPYLAPTPHRGHRNESAYLTAVIDKLAQVYEVTPEIVMHTTTDTACRIFPKIKSQLLPTT